VGQHSQASRTTTSGRGRKWLVIALALLLVAGLGTAVVASPKLRHKLGLGQAVSVASEFTPPVFAIRPVSTDAPAPTVLSLGAELDKLTGAKELGTLTGVVVDPANSTTLWARNSTKALTPGSTGKLLTMAAALLTLKPTDRLTTKVVSGPTADSVVLVGGGDPTLSVLPAGKESVYPGAAKLDDLAKAVKAAHPAPIKTVLVDLSRYKGPTLASGWLPEDVPGGYVTPIEPLILDGGRNKPDELDGARTTTPGLDAGKELAKRLGADPDAVKPQATSPQAPALAEAQSPAIADLVQIALRISDNVLAETLAREVAIARNAEPSFTGSAKAVLAALNEAGLEVGESKMVDGSGLSTDDQVSAKLLGQVMSAAAAPAVGGIGSAVTTAVENGDRKAPPVADRAARLRPLLGGLPVAGGDGTLGDRFLTGPSAPGRGYVRAKTGTLTGVSSLAGTVVDRDGRLLAFAWLSNGTSPADSRPRLDALAATLRACGCR
jgi:D-alanyl-D-alanine carboxypeptidase/D-alanyl-D-alanine-endopeptidase (penicillin-binding protein 4)